MSKQKGSVAIIALMICVIAILVVAILYVSESAPAPVVVEKPGAVSGPDLSSPYFAVNGLSTFYNHVPMQVGTTTLCAMKSPAATSSVELAGFNISIGTSTAASIDIGYGTTPYATSTNLASAIAIGSGALGGSMFFPTAGNGSIVGPNTWLVVKTAGVGLGGYTYRGTCDAEFTVL